MALTSLPMLTPPVPVREMLLPLRMPGVVRTAPLESVRSPLPVLTLPGSESPRPATTLIDWFAPAASVVTVRSLASRRLMAPPVKLLPGRLLKSLPALASVIAPLPVVTTVAPLTTAAPACVTAPLPAAVLTVRLVALIAPSVRALTSVTETAPPIAATLPKLLPALLNVTAPDPALAVVAPLTTRRRVLGDVAVAAGGVQRQRGRVDRVERERVALGDGDRAAGRAEAAERVRARRA